MRAMLNEAYPSIGSVAERIGIPRWKLAYLIQRGDLPARPSRSPAPPLSEQDIERIIQSLKTRQDASPPPRSV